MKAVLAYILSVVIVSTFMFLILGNNFFMSHFILQNQHSMNVTLAKQFIDYEKSYSQEIEFVDFIKESKDYYNENTIKFKYKEVKEEVVENDVVVEVKTLKTFLATVVYKTYDVTEDKAGSVSAETYIRKTFYFSGDKLYIFDKLYENVEIQELSYTEALEVISPNLENISINNIESKFLTENKIKASFLFNTSPFFIGQKFAYNVAEEGLIQKGHVSLDIFGNVREISVSELNADEETTYTLKVYSSNKNLKLDIPKEIVEFLPKQV